MEVWSQRNFFRGRISLTAWKYEEYVGVRSTQATSAKGL